MHLTKEQLLQVIGQQTLDIYVYKMQIEQLQNKIQELTDSQIRSNMESENSKDIEDFVVMSSEDTLQNDE